MKKIHILGIILIAVAIGLLTSASDDMGTYSTFGEATKSGKKVKIAGQLSKDKPIDYDPEIDANAFKFFIKDTDGEEKEVILLKPKPQDFERSEQVVLTGSMKGEQFIATDVLLKCPSKYKDEEDVLLKKNI